MENEIQKNEDTTPNQMIQLAIENKADLGQVRELLELKKLYEADEARKYYASGFALAQSNIEAAIKTALNSQTHSRYAKLEGVIEASRPVYTKEGFSVIFYEGKAEEAGNVRVYADVLHSKGHKETYHFDVPLDGVGIKGNANMTKIHGKASSVSYGRRYLLCMIWNIPTQDDDGNAPNKDNEIKPPGMNKEEEKVLAAICVILQESIPEDKHRKVNTTKVGAIFFAQYGAFPNKPQEVGAAAAWLISLRKMEDWTIRDNNGNTSS